MQRTLGQMYKLLGNEHKQGLLDDMTEWYSVVMGFDAEIAQHTARHMYAFLLDDRMMSHEALWSRLANETLMEGRLTEKGYDIAHIEDVPMIEKLQQCLRDEFLD